MKKFIIFSFMLFTKLSVVAQQDTLRNLQKSSVRTIDKYTTGSAWGYYSGHNHRYVEEYAEKYYIHGSQTLLGIISEHTGKVANGNNISQFKAYTVGSNRLPGSIKASKNVNYGNIDLTGKPMVTIFPTPASVTDSFYVSFNLTDYAHGGFEGDTIGLLYGIHGSRSPNDLSKFGRNATRHHSHGAPIWKDFYSQNFTPVETHFALFPIMKTPNTHLEALETTEFSLSKIFPNPFCEWINIQFNGDDIPKVTMYLYTDTGTFIKTIEIGKGEILPNNTIQINCNELPAGKYIILIKGQTTGIGFNVVKL